MRKQGIVLSVYTIIAAVYIILSLILTSNKGIVFWIGFGVMLFSIVLTTAVTIISNQKQNSAFPVEVSIVTFSAMYVGIVIVINILFGYIFKVDVNTFVSIHIVCFALYTITILFIFVTKSYIIKQNNAACDKICEMQILVYEFEKLKTKLIDMQADSRKKTLPLIDELLDELRFSDFGITVDVSDMDARLRLMAEMLSAEVDNLLTIKSDDTTSMEAIINDIKKVIKDRNMKIKLMNSSI